MSKLLNERLPPDYGALAEAIARNSGWLIIPSGDIVLNELGLSTQVPVVWSYVSTGPYRNYDANGTRLTFKHMTSRDLFSLPRKFAMIVQALKTIGKEAITESVIARLRNQLTPDECKHLKQATMRTTSWIYEAIQQIAKEAGDE